MIKTSLIFFLAISLSFLCHSQNLTQNEISHLKEQILVLDSSNTYKNLKWDSVIEKVKTKKILLLGEFNHGSKEVFTLRNDLIKSLHNNHGYNVILFESGIGELAAIDLYKDHLNPEQLTRGFFGGWRTKEFQELMAFVKEKKINVAGFDIQRTGNNFSELFTNKEVDEEDSLTIASLEIRFSKVKQIISNRKNEYDSIKESVEQLIFDYKKFKTDFDQKHTKILSRELINRTLYNRIQFLSYMLEWQKNKDWHKRWEARDKAMADNIHWLITNFFPNDKVIVVTHNYHISKYNKFEEVMGEFLKATYGDNMYSLGVFASKGSFSNNSGKKEDMSIPDTTRLDIKHIINALSGNVSFLDIPKTEGEFDKWLFSNITVNDTFITLSGDNEMNLSKHFDGLLLIDTVSIPEK